MNKKQKLLAGIIVFVGLFFVVGVIELKEKVDTERTTLSRDKIIVGRTIVVGDCRFNIEIAETPKVRRKGLSDRNSLCVDCGMFFKFSREGKYGFWMKDMRFPIDLLWLKDEEVVGFEKDFSEKSRRTVFPSKPINQVLELNAGKIDKCKIKIGDYLKK